MVAVGTGSAPPRAVGAAVGAGVGAAVGVGAVARLGGCVGGAVARGVAPGGFRLGTAVLGAFNFVFVLVRASCLLISFLGTVVCLPVAVW